MSEKKGAAVKYEEETMELRRGPWTLEEDSLLIHYIASHGEGRWNLLARSSGLKRTGKSCRLRWLNYLKPDVKRGNLTPEEQFLIFELHSKWGNRWSRIAQHLPGRTDNEIKNYWRTRVQKQAKHMKMDAVRCYWSNKNNSMNQTSLANNPQEYFINPAMPIQDELQNMVFNSFSNRTSGDDHHQQYCTTINDLEALDLSNFMADSNSAVVAEDIGSVGSFMDDMAHGQWMSYGLLESYYCMNGSVANDQ